MNDQSTPKSRKLLDQIRDAIRLKHYSYSTEKTYVHWAKRYILFHNKRHPAEMGAAEIEAFLTHLAKRCQNYDDLHSCTQPRTEGGTKSAGLTITFESQTKKRSPGWENAFIVFCLKNDYRAPAIIGRNL